MVRYRERYRPGASYDVCSRGARSLPLPVPYRRASPQRNHGALYTLSGWRQKRSADINRACARRAIWQIARQMAECFSPPLLTFVCSGPMSIKALSKIFVVVAIVVFAGWRAIGHPAYLDLYANDPRSKPEFRAKCAICHEPAARAKEPNFLTDFGAEFKNNRYRITPEMRERFTDIFLLSDQPVSGITADTISIATT